MNAPFAIPDGQGTESGSSVRLAQASDAAAWDRYVAENSESMFFHRFGWSRVISETYGHKPFNLIAEDGRGNTTGILPLILVTSPFFGRALISTAFTVGGGVLGDAAARSALLATAQSMASEYSAKYVELRGGDAPAGWCRKGDTYAGFRKNMPMDEQDNLEAIPRKKRADLRKALKNADAGRLDCQCGSGIGSFYPLYAESMRNLGTPVPPEKYFRLLQEVFADSLEVSVVKADGTPVTALISCYHQNTVLPYFVGASPKARALHANDYIYWAQMRRAADLGMSRFDFGRSKIGTGAYAYKTYWGFKPEPLSYYYYLHGADQLPDINPNNSKFRLLSNAWKRLPLPVANVLGPILAGNLA